MTRSPESTSRRSGMAYFIRRSGHDCSLIALHPDDREEIVARGLAPGDAEDLCASKIAAMRSAVGTATRAIDPGKVAGPEFSLSQLDQPGYASRFSWASAQPRSRRPCRNRA
jgi:hypothetical protein